MKGDNKLVKRISLSSCSSLILTVHGKEEEELGTLSVQTGDPRSGRLFINYQSFSEDNPIALSELREALLLLAEHLKEPPEELY